MSDTFGTPSATMVNLAWSLLSGKNVVPTDFHDQANKVMQMQLSDNSGIVDSLTDFMVNSALTNIQVETIDDKENFADLLNFWLEIINKSKVNYGIELGIRGLAKEYYKERWKGSSFPVLRIGEWENVKGYYLPTVLYFVDGGSIYSEVKSEGSHKLLNYDYYIGSEKKEKIDPKNSIITKPFCRWYEEYPTPYLIKRGVYQNWEILNSIKKRQQEIINQIIPYMLLVKKSTEAMLANNIKSYSNEELQQVVDDFKKAQEKLSILGMNDGTKIRATNADENIEHLIPDISKIFNKEIFVEGEKSILSGLGFIDIADGLSSSRRESVLNPKAFISELNNGVYDFKGIIKSLIFMIQEKNKKEHRNGSQVPFEVVTSPVRAFMSDEFKRTLTQAYDRGNLSKQTYVELVTECDFSVERFRRRAEAKNGTETDLYPHIVRNDEGRGFDAEGIENEEELSDDKKGLEAENYDMAMLEFSVYSKLSELPAALKKYPKEAQTAWMRTWNNAYKYYKNETVAFRTAWSSMKKYMKKHKLEIKKEE